MALDSPNRSQHAEAQRTWHRDQLSLADARSLVRDWLDDRGGDDLCDRMTLAATELLANARDGSGPDDPITIVIGATGDDTCILTVTNRGKRFSPNFAFPLPTQDRGRGLAMVARLADGLDIDHIDGTVRVTARFRY